MVIGAENHNQKEAIASTTMTCSVSIGIISVQRRHLQKLCIEEKVHETRSFGLEKNTFWRRPRLTLTRDRICLDTALWGCTRGRLRFWHLIFEWGMVGENFLHRTGFFFHSHIPHNAPYFPSKFCITLCFSFLVAITAVLREIENSVHEKFWGANKVHYGRCASGVLEKISPKSAFGGI